MMVQQDAPILVHVTRGSLVESVHRGHVAVVSQTGEILASAGNPDSVTYWRSSAKPIQTIPVIHSGAADAFSLTDAELALMCGSHTGQSFHVETAQRILAKIGLSEDNLLCGAHAPADAPSARRLAERGEAPRAVHNNCSGKHAGMLALTRHLGADTSTYLQPDHPVCSQIKECIHQLTDLTPTELVLGTDGCGVPVYGLPVAKMAQAYARLSTPGSVPDLQDAARRVVQAMVSHPEMVAGDHRICTNLMQVGGGRLIAKGGAEAVYCVGLVDAGIGIAIKIECGSSRATPPAIVEILRNLGVLNDDQIEALAMHHRPAVKNVAGKIVGEMYAAIPDSLADQLVSLRDRVRP